MRRLKVTLVVDVAIPDVLPPSMPPVHHDDDAGRLVETIALGALDNAGLAPVSCGYGYTAGIGAGSHP